MIDKTITKKGNEKKMGMVDTLKKMNAILARIVYPICAGIWLSMAALVAAIVNCCCIITIPFGLCCFKLLGLAVWPFGKEVVKSENPSKYAGVGNFLWLVCNGWWILILFFLFWAILVFTPADKELDKVFKYAILPFGKKITKE